LAVVSSAARTYEPKLNESSHVRSRSVDLPSRAARRVAEYLWALGLTDAVRIAALAEQIAAESHVEDADEHAQVAMRRAQERFESWRAAVFSTFARDPEPLWLRGFLAACPEVFLEEPGLARAAVAQFGDFESGRLPMGASFAEQALVPAAVPNWLRGLLVPASLTAAASLALLIALGADGLSALELGWTALFGFLFGLAAIGCFTALLGFSRRAPPGFSGSGVDEAARPAAATLEPLPRSAVIMPIYHESAEQVFAAVAAMREELLACSGGEAFEIFVLSDSRDPALAAEEERAFRRVSASAGESIPVFYRRRALNQRQKAGNLMEFFERWGHRYEYVVVLDADSLMTGATLTQLVSRMHASPRLALLQAPIALAGGETLFARSLQFASSLCGSLFTRGLSRWSGSNANYYGHNAVIRVQAFLACCALPRLEGQPPLGGHILSHDFVEAALLCRGGWEVRLAHDLSGSFEGLPPTLPQYVARDRRWCQGNLQHLRVAAATGLAGMSRLHLLLGVASYLAGPAWLMFLIFGVVLSQSAGSSAYAALGVWIACCTAVLLLLPRLLGLVATLAQRQLRRAHGGGLRLSLGVLFELVLSAALAPLLMLHHTRIVLSILLGRAVGWGTQSRRATGSFGTSLRSEGWTTLCGAALAGGLWLWAPGLLAWLSPIWVPWLLAIPIAALASSVSLGSFTRWLGLLLVPSETEPDPLIARAEELRAFTAGDQAARFRDLVLDPVLVAAHLARLPEPPPGEPTQCLAELRQRALRVGPAGLSEAERQTLARDAESIRWLHSEAWCCWPIESWNLARERPQLPASPSTHPVELTADGSSPAAVAAAAARCG
jgi:membrane glycosyltransferase